MLRREGRRSGPYRNSQGALHVAVAVSAAVEANDDTETNAMPPRKC